jgi:hypothetical protein
LYQLDGIQIKDILSLGTIAELLVISGKTKNIIEIEGGSSQDIALEGNSVSIPGDHLENRLKAHQLETNTGCQAAKACYRSLIVGYIDGVHIILYHFCLFGDYFSFAAAGGTTL